MSNPTIFDKYKLYIDAVQAPDVDAEFFLKVYKENRKKTPTVLREDFCGTFIISAEWVKLNKSFVAHGLDLDPEPLEWGKKNVFSKLTEAQKQRLFVHQMNVLDKKAPKADIIAASNFSYFLFKRREDLVSYFKNCYRTLDADGVLISDAFGGSACYEPNEEETINKNYSYFWDQDSYDPITNFAQFYIHFQIKGQKKVERVFSYDWRLWTLPEIREAMTEAGFAKTLIYWEGTTKSGDGDGNFKVADKAENCDSWIAYIVGLK